METEFLEAVSKPRPESIPTVFSYSRPPGSGLRVPQHTDYKGEPLDASAVHQTVLNLDRGPRRSLLCWLIERRERA